LLLDTHIWVWSLTEPDKLGARVRRALQDPGNELWLSPLSVWELLVLTEKRRIVLDRDVTDWVAQASTDLPTNEAPLTHEVALETRNFRLPHADPVDKLLAATARAFHLTLVTADKRLIGLKGVRVFANR
jgi:PIN domain nuclease of toxin-antitoxin system